MNFPDKKADSRTESTSRQKETKLDGQKSPNHSIYVNVIFYVVPTASNLLITVSLFHSKLNMWSGSALVERKTVRGWERD